MSIDSRKLHCAAMRFLWRVIPAAFLIAAVPALAEPPAVTLRLVANGFTFPVAIAHAGDGSGRLFVVEKESGLVKIVKGGVVLPTPFLNLGGQISIEGERGLLGLAFHPQFSSNRKFYVFYTLPAVGLDATIEVSEFLASTGNPDVADAGTKRIVITIPHPTHDSHNGGHIAFGPDGYLYIGIGDGGGIGDPDNNAQNLSRLLGKLLRISVDGGTPYSIPPSNPFAVSTCNFVDTGICPEIWAYGLRNPWKFSFDRATGDLFIGDVGQSAWEEINFEPAGDAGGRNYGWRMFEGTHCFNPPTGCSLTGHVPPIIEYAHNAQGGRSVTGGYRYRGKKSHPLRGFYIYGDFINSRIWAAEFNGTWSTTAIMQLGAPANISTFGEDEAGEIYFATYSSGNIYAIDGPGPSADVRADFNNDSRSDILWRNTSTGDNAIWLMDGFTVTSGAFILGVPAASPGWTVAGVADFNADGKSDILWRNTSTGDNAIWLMDGFTVASGDFILGVPAASPGWTVAGVADFNADGKSDILWRDTSTGDNAIWLMDGFTVASGNFILGVPAASPGWTISGVGDFNGDGKSDILWRDTSTGDNAIWLMDGFTVASGSFIRGVPAASPGWTISGVGDFNGDGKSDILWRDTSTGDNVIWLMDGFTVASSDFILGVPAASPGWTISGVGDFNGDGKSDILWRDTSTGDNAIWLMDGFTVASGNFILGVPAASPGWSVVNR